MCAAVAAAQEGAKVVLLEKGATSSFRGIDYGGIGTKMQQKSGAKVDKMKAVQEIMRWGGYKADQRVVSLWADHSGEAIDWLVDMAEAAGQTAEPVPLEHQEVRGQQFRTSRPRLLCSLPVKKPLQLHLRYVPKVSCFKVHIGNNCKNLGVDIRFNTPLNS